ncbi:hypothetical protein RHSIM_RhsimUnG0195200 [Rhododendron simsii]|uniref:Uncharacterized protein n=1 Tax=Rhododendron simsii TaxID=118357 RepID=A0A834L471_RHOSS|nr:hypothetical protein RHSIM_RhsimUnG0195200 [Rhododendron simsii]
MLRWRAAIARHGFLSLAIAILPASLHLADVFFIRSAGRATARPSWFLTPLDNGRAFRLLVSCYGPRLLVCVGGKWAACKTHAFRIQAPRLYRLESSVGPIVFGWGAVHLGPHVWMLRGFLAVAIARTIRRQNRTAGEFIFRACGVMGGIHLFQCCLDLLLPERFLGMNFFDFHYVAL